MHPPQRCATCSRQQPVNDRGSCRLCWRHAYLTRRPGERIDLAGANRYGQQLFFAGMHSPHNGYRPPARPCPPPVRDSPTRPAGGQLDLFAPDPIIDGARRYGFPDPPSAAFASALDTASCEHAARHGWAASTTRRARIALRVLLGMAGAAHGPLRSTDVLRLVPLKLSAAPVLAILAAADALDDDRPAPIDAWFTRKVSDLPAPMASELRAWFDIMHRGSTSPPRCRPRADVTIHTRLGWALPTLHAWAQAGHLSLREITRDDVIQALPAAGSPRATLGKALRSIFATLKARRIIFTNPTAGLDVGSFTRRIPLPTADVTLLAALNSADPTQSALAALTAYHGLRQTELRALRLTDIRDGRLYLPDRELLLAEPVKTRIACYLTYRNDRWPQTINPHLFIHVLSGVHTREVSSAWISDRLGVSARAIRQDRILDEAIATGGDSRRICDLFGVTIATATHYTSTINHPGLTDNTEPPPPASSRTQGPR